MIFFSRKIYLWILMKEMKSLNGICFVKNSWEIYTRRSKISWYLNKFVRLDKNLIFDFTDPKKLLHVTYPLYSIYIWIWSKDFEFKYIYTCIRSFSWLIVYYVKIFASFDKNSFRINFLTTSSQRSKTFRTNFHTEFFVTKASKAIQVIELGKKSKPFEFVPIAIFQPCIPNMFANFPIFSQPFP